MDEDTLSNVSSVRWMIFVFFTSCIIEVDSSLIIIKIISYFSYILL